MGGKSQISKTFWELKLCAAFLDTTPKAWSIQGKKYQRADSTDIKILGACWSEDEGLAGWPRDPLPHAGQGLTLRRPHHLSKLSGRNQTVRLERRQEAQGHTLVKGFRSRRMSRRR